MVYVLTDYLVGFNEMIMKILLLYVFLLGKIKFEV